MRLPPTPALCRKEAIIKSSPSDPRRKILVAGVYVADQRNNIDALVRDFASSRFHNVEQSWAALGGTPSPAAKAVTRAAASRPAAKFTIVNQLLTQHRMDDFDYLIVCDDDIELPESFVDRFLYLQTRLDFRLAQPCRTSDSYIDHPIVEQQPGVIARQTWFVESGPLVSMHRSVFELLLPFPLTSDMGWGYENIWSLELADRGLRMGIIDACPVAHRMRRPVVHYDWRDADEGRRRLLQERRHRPIDDCFRVLNIITEQVPV